MFVDLETMSSLLSDIVLCFDVIVKAKFCFSTKCTLCSSKSQLGKREVGEFIGNFGIRVQNWGFFPRKERVSLSPYMVFQVVPRGFPTF